MENKRDRILNSALNRFSQYGFAKTTVDEIARQAQVGKGTIYFYFRNKEEILEEIVDREMTQGFAAMGQAMTEEPTILRKLERILQVCFEYFHGNEMISKVMSMDQGLVMSLVTEKNREFQKISISWIRTLLEQGRNEGVFREMDYDKVGYILDSLIRSFHYLHYFDLELYDPAEIPNTLFELLSRGLVKQ